MKPESGQARPVVIRSVLDFGEGDLRFRTAVIHL